MKNVYISGKINGLDLSVADKNFKDAADKVKTIYESRGEEVYIVNMMDLPLIKMSWADYLIRDLMFLKHCDAIAFMPNWTDSYGAKVEKAFADGLGIEQIYLIESDNNDSDNCIDGWKCAWEYPDKLSNVGKTNQLELVLTNDLHIDGYYSSVCGYSSSPTFYVEDLIDSKDVKYWRYKE